MISSVPSKKFCRNMSGTNPELDQDLYGSEVLHTDKGAAPALNIWRFISCHCKLCSSDKQSQMTEAKLILFIPPCRVTWSAENNSQIYFSHPFFQSLYPTVIFFFSPCSECLSRNQKPASEKKRKRFWAMTCWAVLLILFLFCVA